MIQHIKSLTKSINKRKFLFLSCDVIALVTSLYLAFFLRFGMEISPYYLNNIWIFTITFLIVKLSVFYFFGLYNISWAYVSLHDMLAIVKAVTLSTALLGTSIFFLGKNLADFLIFPRSVIAVDYLLTFIFIGGIRISKRCYLQINFKEHTNGKRVLIVGAGDSGERIVREMEKDKRGRYYPVAFVDDDSAMHKVTIRGVRVLGTRKDIPRLIQKLQIDMVLIAIPSASSRVMQDIVFLAQKAGVKNIQIIPKLCDLISGDNPLTPFSKGEIKINDFREIELDDLLGRNPITIDTVSINEYLKGKRVIVTGAGGSIGSELVRKIATFNPSEILLFEIDETELFYLANEIGEHFPNIHPVLGDITDADKVKKVFESFQPNIIFHAAAYKHVPMMEYYPDEGVKVNVLGTKILAEAAAECGSVEKFVMISTDKAVNPTSVLGATKRIAEYIIRGLNTTSKTTFIAVRFGNVLGSRGSVIPVFQRQIKRGGPVTITHPDMQRYFMTIPEATLLVLQAAAIGNGGEVYVLDMGEPVKILDLAETLIHLSGFEPNRDIPIVFTGMRPGEKLFEEILTAEEGMLATKHANIFIANLSESINTQVLKEKINRLIELSANCNKEKIIESLMDIVPAYSPNNDKIHNGKFKNI
ncbi:polysaccharide biosynthesis protein [bacterium]|nr:polysaccharide biosynthesis protein [bacterium]